MVSGQFGIGKRNVNRCSSPRSVTGNGVPSSLNMLIVTNDVVVLCDEPTGWKAVTGGA